MTDVLNRNKTNVRKNLLDILWLDASMKLRVIVIPWYTTFGTTQ